MPRLSERRERTLKAFLMAWTLAWAPGCAHEQAMRAKSQAMVASLALPQVGGGIFQTAQCRDRVVLVYFLSSWCFPCLADLPLLGQLRQSFRPEELVVLAVGLDLDGEKTLSPFAEQFQLPFPLLVADAELLNGQSAFGRIRGLPTTVLFDRQGKWVTGYHGTVDGKKLKEALRRLVSSP